MRCSKVGSLSSGTRSDSPVPRLSKVMSRVNVAIRSRNRAYEGSSQFSSTFEIQPGT
jgi:hypothetical protein